MTLAKCLDCDTLWRWDVWPYVCPSCGSAHWRSPPEGDPSVTQNTDPNRKSTAIRQVCSHLREYAKALQEDDINAFYTKVVAPEMLRAAELLEKNRS